MFKNSKTNSSKKLITKANFLLNEYAENGNIEYLKAFAEMFIKDELRYKINYNLRDPILIFKEYSLYNNTCSRCEGDINKGDPIFWFGQKYWHMQCSSAEERQQQTYFKEICKKAAAGDKKYTAISLILQEMEEERLNEAEIQENVS